MAKVDLTWADDQYLSTLLKVIGEVAKIYTPHKKEKVSSSEMKKFIKDE